MTANVVGLLASFVVLTVAGDQFVIGIGRLASALRVRPSIVGALIGGFGTALPELIVSAVAAARGDLPIAVGNLVGSIIANVSLGVGLPALIAPIRVDSRTLRREAPISVAAVVLFAALADGRLATAGAGAMTAALVVAVVGLLANARRGTARDELAVEVVDFFGPPKKQSPRAEVTRALVGIAGMVGGAELLVRSGVAVAGRLGVGQGLVGLTIVAVGTSAPLIAANVQAARRRDHDLVVGNMLGSNLFIALAGGAIVGFLAASSTPALGAGSLWLMVGMAVAAVGFMGRGATLWRWEAGVLLIAYGATLPFVAH